MNPQLVKVMNERDFDPPPGVKPMVVRRRTTRHVGPYVALLETSCDSGPPHVAGSARIRLFDVRLDADVKQPEIYAQEDWGRCIGVKRFAADSWRECDSELTRVIHAVGGN